MKPKRQDDTRILHLDNRSAALRLLTLLIAMFLFSAGIVLATSDKDYFAEETVVGALGSSPAPSVITSAEELAALAEEVNG